jgi:hypothetical protein
VKLDGSRRIKRFSLKLVAGDARVSRKENVLRQKTQRTPRSFPGREAEECTRE